MCFFLSFGAAAMAELWSLIYTAQYLFLYVSSSELTEVTGWFVPVGGVCFFVVRLHCVSILLCLTLTLVTVSNISVANVRGCAGH